MQTASPHATSPGPGSICKACDARAVGAGAADGAPDPVLAGAAVTLGTADDLITVAAGRDGDEVVRAVAGVHGQPDDAAPVAGLKCRVRAWGPGKWYPMAKPELALVLTEFPDPAGETVYLHVPNPNDPRFEEDELVAGSRQQAAGSR